MQGLGLRVCGKAKDEILIKLELARIRKDTPARLFSVFSVMMTG